MPRHETVDAKDAQGRTIRYHCRRGHRRRRRRRRFVVVVVVIVSLRECRACVCTRVVCVCVRVRAAKYSAVFAMGMDWSKLDVTT